MQVSVGLDEVDILQLSSESQWSGVGIFHISMGLGRWIVKESDRKLTLGMAERDRQQSLHLMRSIKNLGQTQSHSLSESGCFLSN